MPRLRVRRYSTLPMGKETEAEGLFAADAPLMEALDSSPATLPKGASPRPERKSKDREKAQDRDAVAVAFDRDDSYPLELTPSETSLGIPADATPPPKKKGGFFGLLERKPRAPKAGSKPPARLFGEVLELVAGRDGWSSGDRMPLPTIVRTCVEVLETRGGLTTLGLYRISGQKSLIDAARAAFEHGEDPFLRNPHCDMTVVASVLKLYLRELPRPVLPATSTHALFSALRSDVVAARDILCDVPRPSYTLLGWMVLHLTHVIAHADVNRMSAQNIAILFSPTLHIAPELLLLLFDHVRELFPDIRFAFDTPPPATSNHVVPTQTDCESIVPREHSQRLCAEIAMLEHELEKLHTLVQANPDQSADRVEQMWSLQRDITDRKRELKRLIRPVDMNAVHAVVDGRAVATAVRPQLSVSAILHTLLAELEAQRAELVAVATHLSNQIAVEHRCIASLNARLALTPQTLLGLSVVPQSRGSPHRFATHTQLDPTASALGLAMKGKQEIRPAGPLASGRSNSGEGTARRTNSGDGASGGGIGASVSMGGGAGGAGGGSSSGSRSRGRGMALAGLVDGCVAALRAELAGLVEDGDALRRHTQELARDCLTSILDCVTLRVQINAATPTPVFSRRWTYRTLETVADAAHVASESGDAPDDESVVSHTDGAGESLSIMDYDSDVVECDNTELDDRDPGDLAHSKQPSPLPSTSPPPPAASPPPTPVPASVMAAGLTAQQHLVHLDLRALAAQARLLGDPGPDPSSPRPAARRLVHVEITNAPSPILLGSPLASRSVHFDSTVLSASPVFAATATTHSRTIPGGPVPAASDLPPLVVPTLPVGAEAAMLAGSEASTHPPSSDSSLTADLVRQGRAPVDSPRLDSRLSFGLLNLSGSHSTLV